MQTVLITVYRLTLIVMLKSTQAMGVPRVEGGQYTPPPPPFINLSQYYYVHMHNVNGIVQSKN